jgi:hypothetical protein
MLCLKRKQDLDPFGVLSARYDYFNQIAEISAGTPEDRDKNKVPATGYAGFVGSRVMADLDIRGNGDAAGSSKQNTPGTHYARMIGL